MIRPEVVDDSEVDRLRELLDSNGFTVEDVEVRSWQGRVMHIIVRVIPEPQ